MIALYWPALLAALVIVLIEMSEVLALVFALSGDSGSVRAGGMGALLGIAIIASASLAAGSALIALPRIELLGAAAVALFGFGAFLARSTLREYRKARFPEVAARFPPRLLAAVPFAGGLTIGLVESTEAAIVLLALAAAGYATSALLGAVVAGAALAVTAALVHDRIRSVKSRWLKLGGTALLLAYGTFWAGEAFGFAGPGGDLFLLPLFAVFVVGVRGAIEGKLRLEARDRPSSAGTST